MVGEMKALDSILEKHTSGPTRTHHALTFIAVDSSDAPLYSHSAGSASLNGGQPLDANNVYWIASQTKLMTAIACMQVVERGLIGLDDDVGEIVPQLKDKDILVGFEGEGKTDSGVGADGEKIQQPDDIPVDGEDIRDQVGRPILRKARNKITLRLLLTHTSGFTYDLGHEGVQKWATYNKRTDHVFSGTMESYNIPLIFEPGEDWSYGPGLDWAGHVVEVLTNQSLEDFMKENIWKPLGMNDTTFHPERRSDMESRRVEMANRPASGDALEPGSTPLVCPVQVDHGGLGTYSTPNDYAKLLRAILNGGEPLLKRKSVDEMLRPQMTDRRKFTDKRVDEFPWGKGVDADYSLAGAINLDDCKGRRAKHSVTWGGMPNLHWWIDRQSGIAATLFTQLLPTGDKLTGDMVVDLEYELYKALSPKL